MKRRVLSSKQQIAALGMTGSAIKSAVTEFIARLSLPTNLLIRALCGNAPRESSLSRSIASSASAKGLVTGIIEIIKDAILKPIAKLAEGTEGYNLLKGMLGKDPITGNLSIAAPRHCLDHCSR